MLTGEPLEPRLDEVPAGSVLREPRGAFVSLHTTSGELRGCVGALSSTQPLAETVAEMAFAAATRDLRFTPVTPAELDHLLIEVSVLGPLEPVRDLSEVEIGRHGLLVKGHGHRGVLLPQVATEHGWDAETFAAQTCIKAGLSPDAYLRGEVELHRFEAEVILEAPLARPSL